MHNQSYTFQIHLLLTQQIFISHPLYDRYSCIGWKDKTWILKLNLHIEERNGFLGFS